MKTTSLNFSKKRAAEAPNNLKPSKQDPPAAPKPKRTNSGVAEEPAPFSEPYLTRFFPELLDALPNFPSAVVGLIASYDEPLTQFSSDRPAAKHPLVVDDSNLERFIGELTALDRKDPRFSRYLYLSCRFRYANRLFAFEPAFLFRLFPEPRPRVLPVGDVIVVEPNHVSSDNPRRREFMDLLGCAFVYPETGYFFVAPDNVLIAGDSSGGSTSSELNVVPKEIAVHFRNVLEKYRGFGYNSCSIGPRDTRVSQLVDSAVPTRKTPNPGSLLLGLEYTINAEKKTLRVGFAYDPKREAYPAADKEWMNGESLETLFPEVPRPPRWYSFPLNATGKDIVWFAERLGPRVLISVNVSGKPRSEDDNTNYLAYLRPPPLSNKLFREAFCAAFVETNRLHGGTESSWSVLYNVPAQKADEVFCDIYNYYKDKERPGDKFIIDIAVRPERPRYHPPSTQY